MPSPINIKSYKGEYQAIFTSAQKTIKNLSQEESNYFVIDRNILRLYPSLKATIPEDRMISVEAKEENKDLTRIPQYINALVDKSLKRNCTLVAIGGGITQDITCFIASTLFRGIDWAFIPTTLLAQADSCIGSKSSINCDGVKNLVGTFTPPRRVYLDVNFLETLEKKDVLSGIGEMIKVHMVDNIKAFRDIQQNYKAIIEDKKVLEKYLYDGLLYKKKLIEVDEFDKGPRNIMNYGHTFGHAIEVAVDYKIPHGIAVTIGMDMANQFSDQMKFCPPLANESHSFLKQNFGVLEGIRLNAETFFSSISKDKKNIGKKLTLILPKGEQFKLEKVQYPLNDSFKDFCQNYFKSIAIY